MARVGSNQPSTTYDPTKSPGVGWLGITVVREYGVGRKKRGRGGMGRETDMER